MGDICGWSAQCVVVERRKECLPGGEDTRAPAESQELGAATRAPAESRSACREGKIRDALPAALCTPHSLRLASCNHACCVARIVLASAGNRSYSVAAGYSVASYSPRYVSLNCFICIAQLINM